MIKKTIDFSKKQNLEKKETINPKVKQINITNKSNYQNISSSNIISSERTSYFKKSNIKNQKLIKLPQSKTINNNNNNNNNNNGLDPSNNNIKIYEIDNYSEKKIEKKNLIKKLDTNIFCTYFCFCFSRKRENFANTLMDEAMKIITEKLDIYNIFRNMYYIDDLKKKTNYIYEDIEISDECKHKLKEISNKIYNSFYQL